MVRVHSGTTPRVGHDPVSEERFEVLAPCIRSRIDPSSVCRRLFGLTAVLAVSACGGDPVEEQTGSESVAEGTSTTATSSTSAISVPDVGQGSSDTSGTDVDTESSASSGPDDECPPGNDGWQDLGTFVGVEKVWWTNPTVPSVEQAECVALSKELCNNCFDVPTWLVLLQCTKLDVGMEMHEVQLWSSVPEVEPVLDDLLDGQSFGLRTAGRPDGQGVKLTIRNEVDDLLLLASVEIWKYPGDQVSDVDFEGWNAPFDTFLLRDEGCSWRTIPIPGGETERRPYAIEFSTDRGTSLLFDREKALVEVGGVMYDVIVDSAAALDVSSCGGDCVDSEASFTIVRR
jgi:hypothetical protein